MWSTTAFDEFLASAIRRPVIRLVEHGQPVPSEQYTGKVRLGGSDFRDVVDPSRVAERFAAGATVVAQSLHRTHPDVRRFAERLGDEISHPVQANSYLTPPRAIGLAPHSDRHDVFVVQVAGSKRWTVDGIGELDVAPGDTLYIPADTRHSAASTDKASLHLTIGVLRVTYRAVLNRLLRNGPDILDDPLPLRYRSTGSGSESGMNDELGKMLDAVVAHVGRVDAAELGESERTRTTARPPRQGALVGAVELSELNGRTRLRRSDADWSLSSMSGDRVELIAGSRRMVTPESCAPALKILDERGAVRVEELAGLDSASQIILARRLVAAQFATIGRPGYGTRG